MKISVYTGEMLLKKWLAEKIFKKELENYHRQLEKIIKNQKTEIKNLKNRLNYYNNKGGY